MHMLSQSCPRRHAMQRYRRRPVRYELVRTVWYLPVGQAHVRVEHLWLCWTLGVTTSYWPATRSYSGTTWKKSANCLAKLGAVRIWCWRLICWLEKSCWTKGSSWDWLARTGRVPESLHQCPIPTIAPTPDHKGNRAKERRRTVKWWWKMEGRVHNLRAWNLAKNKHRKREAYQVVQLVFAFTISPFSGLQRISHFFFDMTWLHTTSIQLVVPQRPPESWEMSAEPICNRWWMMDCCLSPCLDLPHTVVPSIAISHNCYGSSHGWLLWLSFAAIFMRYR